MTLDGVLPLLAGVRRSGKGYTAKCPSHDDGKNSLSVSEGNNSSIVLHCHAGCSVGDICRAIGIEIRDLFPETDEHGRWAVMGSSRREVCAYPYCDEQGNLLYENVRFEPKDFRARRYADGRPTWNLNGTRRVLYRLPELLRAKASGEVDVFGCEGEKDVEAVRSLGFIATNIKQFKAEFATVLSGLNFTILQDHDEPGVKNAQHVVAAIGMAAKTKIVDLYAGESLPAKDGKDVSDWIAERTAAGLDKEAIADELARIVETAPEQHLADPLEVQGLTPIPFQELLDAYPEPRSPVIDGLLRQGEIGNIIAKSKVGKSWLVYYILLCLATGTEIFGRFKCSAGPVCLIDNEVERGLLGTRICRTADAMGLKPDQWRPNLEVLALRGNSQDVDELECVFRARKDRYQFIAVDALYRTFPKNMPENGNSELRYVYERFVEYAEMTGSAIGLVHHATKGGQADKDIVDVGAGGSSQARVPDSHIILRPHKVEDCVVLEAETRSFPKPEALTLRRHFPLWLPALDLDAKDLKGGAPSYQERKQAEDTLGMETVYGALLSESDTIKGLAGRVGMGQPKIQRLVGALVQAGRVDYQKIKKRGQECNLYRPVQVDSFRDSF